jgi:hydrogenase maturation protease
MPAGKFLVGYFSAGKLEMQTELPVEISADLLVIGYGNTLRRDDGVGPRVAETIESLNLRGVSSLACHQLSPEHAEAVARARQVVFVDAAVDDISGIKLRKLQAGKTTQLMAHAADPSTLLALARDVFGHAPEAWWLTIPAVKLGFGTDFSKETEAGFRAAVIEIRHLAEGMASQCGVFDNCCSAK